MNPTPITTKHEMYRRLNAGLLGQTLPAAETIWDIYKLALRYGKRKTDPFNTIYVTCDLDDKAWAVRSKLSNSSCFFNVSVKEAIQEAERLGDGNFNFSPMLDDTKRVIYAHLNRDPVGHSFETWNLHYTTDPKPARLLESKDGCQQKWMTGLKTKAYLRSIMDDIGWETLNRLVSEYPDHCIEFTVMSSSLDAFGPSNTVFWEVRTLTGEYERDTFKKGKR